WVLTKSRAKSRACSSSNRLSLSGRVQDEGRTPIESTNMKIMIVVGARPNFMKAAPLIAAIREHNQRTAALSPGEQPIEADQIEGVLVHTGQHYDEDSFNLVCFNRLFPGRKRRSPLI